MPEPNQTFFDCELIERRVENDSFVTYLADSAEFGRVELLVVKAEARLSGKKHADFLLRANQLAEKGYANIGLPLKAGEFGGQLACLYPLPEGRSLAASLAEPSTVREVLSLISQLAGAMVTPHAEGEHHGHLSPGTVFVRPDGTPWLNEFSLGQLLLLDFHSGIDPGYCSPEQVRGEGTGPESDIYSLGCLLFSLLTGKPPFSGTDDFAIATQHLEGIFPELPPEFSCCHPLLAALVPIIPGQRLSAAELVDSCSTLLADPGTEALKCFRAESDPAVSPVSPSAPAVDRQEAEVSDIAARVAARLQEHTLETREAEGLVVDPPFENAEPHPQSKGSNSRLRMVGALIAGVLLGSLSFQLFSDPVPQLEERSAQPHAPVLNDSLFNEPLSKWQKSDFSTAREELDALLQSYPDDPRPYNNLAAMAAFLGDYGQARQYLEKALATSPVYSTVHRNLAAIYTEMARDSYGKALQLKEQKRPLPLQVFSGQGIIFLKTDQAATALAAAKSHPGAVTEGAEGQQAAGNDGVAAALAPAEPGPSEPAQGSTAETAAPTTAEEQPAGSPSSPVGAVTGTADIKAASAETAQGAEPETAALAESAEQFMRRWATAWSQQDVESYLAFYSADFQPAGHRTREAWERQRRNRLRNPETIQVDLDAFKVVKEQGSIIVLEAVQHYQSNRYSDVSRKQFELKHNPSGWSILRERSVERIR